MPFEYDSRNLSPIVEFGQTLRNMQGQNARMELQASMARQQALRDAVRDKRQFGLWDAQGQQARSQAALDQERMNEIIRMAQDVETFGQSMGQMTNANFQPSPEMMTGAGRLVARGQDKVPLNMAQMRALFDSRLSALMATGSHIPGHVPAAATAVDAASGGAGWTAAPDPFNPANNLAGTLGAAVKGTELFQEIPGEIPSPTIYDPRTKLTRSNPNYEAFMKNRQTVQLLMDYAQWLYGNRATAGSQPAPTPSPIPPPAAPPQAPRVPLPPGVPVGPPGGSVIPREGLQLGPAPALIPYSRNPGQVWMVAPNGELGQVPAAQAQEAIAEKFRPATLEDIKRAQEEP